MKNLLEYCFGCERRCGEHDGPFLPIDSRDAILWCGTCRGKLEPCRSCSTPTIPSTIRNHGGVCRECADESTVFCLRCLEPMCTTRNGYPLDGAKEPVFLFAGSVCYRCWRYRRTTRLINLFCEMVTDECRPWQNPVPEKAWRARDAENEKRSRRRRNG